MPDRLSLAPSPSLEAAPAIRSTTTPAARRRCRRPVDTSAADERIRTAATRQGVVARRAFEAVGGGVARDDVVEARADDVFDP